VTDGQTDRLTDGNHATVIVRAMHSITVRKLNNKLVRLFKHSKYYKHYTKLFQLNCSNNLL